MRISEVFGKDVDDVSATAVAHRQSRLCPFRNTRCTKSSKTDPLGVCTLSDGVSATALCPVRFLEEDRIFADGARLAFGTGVEFAVFPEIRILRIEGKGEAAKKIGKVDFLLGQVSGGKVVDFAAMEVQAVYFSGISIRPAMRHFLKEGALDVGNSDRRPDFRSSAQKRLAPQLMLKVPVFRRWAKKFFVVVDSKFFGSLPTFRTASQANSELTWLSYRIQKGEGGYKLQPPLVTGSIWEDVANALREGVAPEPGEISEELQKKLSGPPSTRPRMLMS